MSKAKLLYKTKDYAKDAIAVIEQQLQKVKSQKRKTQLEEKLKQWKKTLEIFEA